MYNCGLIFFERKKICWGPSGELLNGNGLITTFSKSSYLLSSTSSLPVSESSPYVELMYNEDRRLHEPAHDQ